MTLTLPEYALEVVAVLRHQHALRCSLSPDEVDRVEWARAQGYRPEATAFDIISHRAYGEWDLPAIIRKDDA